jgi:signal transduction histidine kinase
MKRAATRHTGIGVIGDVPWGTHFCQFYQSKADLIDILVPYFREGLENNEFCMWITSHPLDADEARKAMRAAMPDFDAYDRKGQIEIIPYDAWYVQDGVFDRKRVLQAWVDKLECAQKRGYEGLRLTGNTFWLEKTGWRDFTDYEEEINKVIGRYRMMALCTYSIDKCGANEVIDVVQNHQFALMKREGQWVLIESSERKRAEEEILRLNQELTQAVEDLRQKSYALAEANASLQQLDRLKSMFISSMSHELRTPLTSIIGFSGIMLQGMVGDLNAEQRKQLTMVKDSANHLLALINDVIDISKIEADKVELSLGEFDLAELVWEVAASVEVLIKMKRLALSVVAPRPIRVVSDRRRVKQILVNLLGNAVKFTDHGGIEIRLEDAAAQGARIVVKDSGIGISRENIGKLFGAFTQIHTEGRPQEGSGLGLYLSRKIANLLGGEITVESELGAGSAFTVRLPAEARRVAA